MITFFDNLKKTSKPRGLYVAATDSSVVLYNNGATIRITPELADKLAEALPRYADISRSLKKDDTQ